MDLGPLESTRGGCGLKMKLRQGNPETQASCQQSNPGRSTILDYEEKITYGDYGNSLIESPRSLLNRSNRGKNEPDNFLRLLHW